MNRTVTVTLDDGSKVVYENVPADVTPDQVTARAQSESGKAVRELDGGKPENQIERKAKVGGSAVARGAAGLPALFGDLASRASQYLPTTPFGVPPNPQEVTAKPMEMPLSAAVQSFGPKPETTAEKYFASILEGVGGSLTGGAGGVARSSFIGGMSGLGSEAGAQISGDESAFLPRLLGGLAGGGLGAIFSGRLGLSPRVQELARESLDGVDPAKVAAARSFMESSGRQGVNIDAAQALEGVGANPSGIRVLRDTLANVKEGDATQSLLRTQPSQLQQRGATWLGQVPGNVYSPEQAANNLSETATAAINAAKKARSAEVKGLYAQAGQLPSGTTQQMSELLDDFVSQPGVTDTTKRAVKRLQAKLVDTPTGPTVAQLQQQLASATKASEKAAIRAKIQQALNTPATYKPMHAKDADTMISQFVGQYKGTPISPADPIVRGEVKILGQRLNKVLQDASPAIKSAEARFGQISRDVIDPLKQGQIGGLATKAGYRGDVQAPMAKMNALFSAGRDPATSHSPLLETARKLNKQDPQAFRDAAKTYYSGKISNAFEADIGGALPTNKDAADRIYKELFQYQPQYTAMKDSVTAAAESAGVKPAEALRGLDNFAKIVKATRSQPDQIGGMTKQQIVEMAEKHHGANFIRIFGFLPFERMARNLESATMSKTLREMDKLITTPEGLKILAELSKQPVMSRQALALAATAGAVLSQTAKTDQSTD